MFTSPVDDGVVAFLVEQIVGAVTDAHAALQPAVIGYGAGHLDSISRNRQRHNDTLDPEVGVLRVQSAASPRAPRREMTGLGPSPIMFLERISCGNNP